MREGIHRIHILRIIMQFCKRGKEACEQVLSHPKTQVILKSLRESETPDTLGTALILGHTLVRNVGFGQVKEVILPHKRLLAIYEDCVTAPGLKSVAVASLYQLTLLVSQSDEVFQAMRAAIGTKSFFVKLTAGLLSPTIAKESKNSVVRFEGSHMVSGLLDHLFSFLDQWLDKIDKSSKEEVSLFFLLLKETETDRALLEVINWYDKEAVLSPKGFTSYLMFLWNAASKRRLGGTTFAEGVTSEGFLSKISGLLSDSLYVAISSHSGYGEAIAENLATQLIMLLQTSFNPAVFPSEPERDERLIRLKQQDITSKLIGICNVLKTEKTMLVYQLLSKLLTSPKIEKEVCQQFFKARGLTQIKRLGLFEHDWPALQLELISIVCQFCRLGKVYYEAVHELDIYPYLKKCMQHAEPSIRAKTHNLLGHMCRHNAFFYDHLLKHGLLSDCIAGCSDADPATRRFACFALGNAAFHNDKLYHVFKPAIRSVVQLLRDPDERTRANAAGALGNFARNSAVLVPELMVQSAVDALFTVALKDPSTNAQRVALFSLGNLCLYQDCKKHVIASEALMSNLRKIARALEGATDELYIKYAQRFLERVQGGNDPAGRVVN